MRSLVLSVIVVASLAACSHTPPPPPPKAAAPAPVASAAVRAPAAPAPAPKPVPPPAPPNGLKHAVMPVQVDAALEKSAVPSIFEHVFCNALFEINDHQAICAEDIRAMLKIQQERATLGAEAMTTEEIGTALDAPRRVSLVAAPGAKGIFVTANVIDSSAGIIGKFQATLAVDGSDAPDRARDLAARVAGLPR